MENKTAFSILKEFRSVHDMRATRAMVSFIIFLGIFIIDAVFIMGSISYNGSMNLFSWVGVWCLILAMAFSLKDHLLETKEVKKIDSYYMERLYNYEHKR
jgi:hypothetical protein